MLPVISPPPPLHQATPGQADLRSLSPEELGRLVERLGEKPFRAKQLFRWLHHKGAASFDEMTDLPKGFRERLAAESQLTTLVLDAMQVSTDGTRKYRFKTFDGRLIESVYMPDEPGEQPFETDDELDPDEREDERQSERQGERQGERDDAPAPKANARAAAGEAPLRRKRVRRTLCVSTQVGCAMGCGFCLTSTMGLIRNLTPGEIADQVYRVNADLRALGRADMDAQRPLTNLVYMGMGEPLHNFVHVKRSLELLLHADGANFSHRHVTVSTSGLVPNIQRLGEETQVKLAVSLNATTDEQRARLMPVDKKWNIAALIDACKKFPMKHGRRITFEYVLLGGVNDTDEDAVRLAELLRGMAVKVNLIPYNENPGLGFGDPGAERVAAFKRVLEQHQVTTMVRKNRGRDISAACGQLAVAGQKESRPKA